MTIQTHDFSNGFRLIYEKPFSKVNITNIKVYCKLGSANENTEDTHGVSHFIEHMCFKGTKKIPKPIDIFTKYDEIGAYFNATTDKEHTYYSVKCDDDYVCNCLYILSDMLINSTFNEKEYKKEEKVVIEENEISNDDPEDILDENVEMLLYEGTSYARPVDTISYHKNRLNHKTVKYMYDLFYHPHQMVISVVSHLPFENVIQMIEKTYFIKTTKKLIEIPEKYKVNKIVLPQNNIKYSFKKKTGFNVSHLCVCFRTTTDDKYVLNLLNYILSGPMSAKLFMILREENGLTYSSDTDTNYYDAYGDFRIYASAMDEKILKNGKKKGVLPLLINLINHLIKQGVNEEEIVLAKGYLKGTMELDLEDSDTLTSYNGENLILYENKKIIPYSHIFEEKYKNITKKQIDDVIKKYFKKQNMTFCFIGEKLNDMEILKQECEKICQ